MTRLHLFDLDGTLIHGSSASIEISHQLGLGREITELEGAFALGDLDPPGFARGIRELWCELTEQHVQEAFEAAPWLSNIRDVWADISARGERCAVISLSPDFFVHRLLDWGVHAARGSRFPTVPFDEPIEPDAILSAAAKVTIARELCTRYDLRLTDCVAYGDSMSDAALFDVVPISIAINADHHLADLATASYAGTDLRAAYELARRSPGYPRTGSR